MPADHLQYSTVFDDAKARRELDFEYTIPFGVGVRRTVERLDENDAVDSWDSEDDDELIAAWRESVEGFEVAIDQEEV